MEIIKQSLFLVLIMVEEYRTMLGHLNYQTNFGIKNFERKNIETTTSYFCRIKTSENLLILDKLFYYKSGPW